MHDERDLRPMSAAPFGSGNWRTHSSIFVLQPGSKTGSRGFPGLEPAIEAKFRSGKVDSSVDRQMLGGPEPPLVAGIVDSLMRAVINDRIAGNGGEIGNALVASLQQAIKKYS